MLKNLFFALVLSTACWSTSLAQSNNNVEFFAQGNFNTSSNNELNEINSLLASNQNIRIFRFDGQGGKFMILTQNINTFTMSDLTNWLGTFTSTVSCIQIGVNGVDNWERFPFENCND